MPDYKNETTRVVYIRNSQGELVELSPGGHLETEHFCDHEALGLTQVAEAPYWEREVADTVLTSLSSTAQEVEINQNARVVLVHMITGTVTVRRNREDAVPVMRDHSSENVMFTIPVDTRTKRLMITGSGTCRVLQLREF